MRKACKILARSPKGKFYVVHFSMNANLKGMYIKKIQPGSLFFPSVNSAKLEFQFKA
jgi:hypothetical protein